MDAGVSKGMPNTLEYESQAWFGNTVVKSRFFEATGTDEAKEETRRWLAELHLRPPATQLVLRLGGQVAWASPLPEAP
jgi:hypothetical protein